MIALGIVLPMAFHSIPNAGGIFLPMHIPVLLCGLVCGPVFGVVCGIFTPLLSSVMTGMPPVAVMPGMIFELAIYGLTSGLLYRVIKTKYAILDIYAALIPSMLLGRAIAGFVNGLIFLSGKYTITVWATASFVTALPGILIQLILIPTLVFALRKSNLIDVDKTDIWGLKTAKLVKRNKEFFNGLAERWDDMNDVSDERLHELVALCKIKEGDRVLDVACGTGIIDNELIAVGAASVTAIDVSDKMIDIAKSKNTDERIKYLCADFYKLQEGRYDKIVIFNAYPHFTDKSAFVKKLHELLTDDGSFIVLHSSSPASINKHHSGGAKKVSKPLQTAADETHWFRRYFELGEIIDDGTSYMIYGTKKPLTKKK